MAASGRTNRGGTAAFGRRPPFVGSYSSGAAVGAGILGTAVFTGVVTGAFTGAFTDVFTGVFPDVFTSVFTDAFTGVITYFFAKIS